MTYFAIFAVFLIGSIILILFLLDNPIKGVARRAGGVFREIPPTCLQKMELGQFGIGFVGNGYTDLRFYPDGIGATSWSLGGELFFPFTILAIVPNRRMGDPCKFKIVSRVNNRELVLSPYDRPKVLEFLKEHGVAMQE